ITAASRHDYLAFFEAELPLRRELRYPPFGRLARIMLAGTYLQTVRSEIEKLARVIDKQNVNKNVTVLGPSPAVLEKIRSEYRYSLLVKSSSPKTLSEVLASIRLLENNLPEKMKLVIDVDPVYML
ncbi:MAG: hypothetical protein JW768_05165, partial [Chitinispirillaceae bacterium]|nr:hypothetical protein [Chitinispirillaceae bacterium]